MWISEALGGEQRPPAKQDLARRVTQKVVEEWRWLSSFNDPHGIYARLRFELDLN